jgi:tetratricopeptide (TPR) repeat protein
MELQEEKIEKFSNGEITLAEVINMTPRQEAALISLGYTFYSNGRFDDATKILEGLAMINSNLPYVCVLLGSIYQKKKDYEKAIEQYTRALTLDSHDIYCFANRGEILLRLGRFQEATSDLMKAIEADNDKKHPAANRARVLLALTQDAVKALYMVAGA